MQPATQNAASSPQLKRALTIWSLITFGLVVMLPFAPAQVYAETSQKTFGMICLVYLIGVVAMLFHARNYSIMSQAFPTAGASYSFIRHGMNPFMGFLGGWAMLLEYIMVSALLLQFSTYWLDLVVPGLQPTIMIILFAILITLCNALGIVVAKWFNYVVLGAQLVMIAVFLICSIKFVFIDGQGTGGISWDAFFQVGKINPALLAEATTLAVLGFLGFDSITTLSEEAKDTKMVSRAIPLSLIVIAFLFMSQAFMASLVHPDYASLDPFTGFFDIVREAAGDTFADIFIWVAVIAIVANALTALSAVGRLIFAMGRDRAIPVIGKQLAYIHPSFKTPVVAIAVLGVIAGTLAALMEIGDMFGLVSIGAMTTFGILSLAVPTYFYFRLKNRDLKGTINYLIVPLIGFAITVFIFTGFTARAFTIGGIWMSVGLIIAIIKSLKKESLTLSE